jgi:hypothetical protein
MTRNTQFEQIVSAVHSDPGRSIAAFFPRALSRLRRFDDFFEVFRRLFVVICVPSPWSSVPGRIPARECWNPVPLPPPSSPEQPFSPGRLNAEIPKEFRGYGRRPVDCACGGKARIRSLPAGILQTFGLNGSQYAGKALLLQSVATSVLVWSLQFQWISEAS